MMQLETDNRDTTASPLGDWTTWTYLRAVSPTPGIAPVLFAKADAVMDMNIWTKFPDQNIWTKFPGTVRTAVWSYEDMMRWLDSGYVFEPVALYTAEEVREASRDAILDEVHDALDSALYIGESRTMALGVVDELRRR